MILIGHPGRQHSHHFAAAAFDGGYRTSYCSGQFDAQQLSALPSWLQGFMPAAISRNLVPFLAPGVHTTWPFGVALHHVTRPRFMRRFQYWGEWAGFAAFDWWLARQVAMRRPRMVIAYEMAALRAFRTAAKHDVLCVLDAAACHHRLQDSRLGVDSAILLSKAESLIRARKDEELILADMVICPSTLSAESYLAAGVPAHKIVVNTLGVDAEMFGEAAGQQPRNGVPHFAFIANSAYVKGADLVASAVASLQAANCPAVIDLVGGAHVEVASSATVRIVRHGHLSPKGVAGVLAKADCLLLPSRLESFGMVVLEALAAGVPVLVSRWAGASMVIEEDVTGWTFDSDPEVFISRVRWCAANVTQLRSMRGACIIAARQHSWQAYRTRAANIIGALLSDRNG